MFLFKQIKLVLPGIGSVLDDSGAWDQVEWCPVSSSEAAAVGLSDRLLGFELHFELSSSSSCDEM